MPRKADFIFEVNIRIVEAFTLDSIVRHPRTFKPKDVQDACQNNELIVKAGEPPAQVVKLATYMMTDFFAMAHATGLYNRQRGFWESLAKVNTIAVSQQMSGLIHKKPLPIFDFKFLDYKGKTLISVNLIAEPPEKNGTLIQLKQFIRRLPGRSSLTGILVCFPAPFPQDVLQYIGKQTHTQDPVGKYESIMPSLRVPIDLLEMAMEQTDLIAGGCQEDVEAQELRKIFQLVHPDLKKGKQPLVTVVGGKICQAPAAPMSISETATEMASENTT